MTMTQPERAEDATTRAALARAVAASAAFTAPRASAAPSAGTKSPDGGRSKAPKYGRAAADAMDALLATGLVGGGGQGSTSS